MHYVISIQKIGDRHVATWLHDPIDPPHDEWQRAYDQITAYKKVHGCTNAQMSALVVTDGGAPNSRERALLVEVSPVPIAVVTTVLVNPIKRGIATALGWTNPRYQFNEPKQWQRALAHVGIGGFSVQAWACYRELQKQMPPNATLALIADACALPSLAEVARKQSAQAGVR